MLKGRQIAVNLKLAVQAQILGAESNLADGNLGSFIDPVPQMAHALKQGVIYSISGCQGPYIASNCSPNCRKIRKLFFITKKTITLPNDFHGDTLKPFKKILGSLRLRAVKIKLMSRSRGARDRGYKFANFSRQYINFDRLNIKFTITNSDNKRIKPLCEFMSPKK